MLPAETVVDVVSFLGFYDLGGVNLSNKSLSAVARRCADGIRLFDFSDFEFHIDHCWIKVCRLDSYGSSVCPLEFTCEANMAEFVSEAFRNCTVGCLSLLTPRQYVLNAIKVVARTVAVAGTLEFFRRSFENEQELLERFDHFRRVKKLTIYPSRRVSLNDESLKTFCQRKDITLQL